MRAARFYGRRDIRVENDVPWPELQPGQVQVDIEWCGICGTDMHEYLVGPVTIPTQGNPHPMTGESVPVTMGHEFCGRVGKVNAGSELKVGQAVMVDPRLFCGKCHRCDEGETNICTKWGFKGLQGRGGGFSEAVAVDEDMCHVLPETVPLSKAALIEPLVVARHALKMTGFERGDFEGATVLIIGGGPVGIAVIYNLRARGVKRIFVSEPTVKRQGQLRDLADEVLNPVRENVAERCREMTGGEGVDLVFDCAGIAPGLRDGMDALKGRGTYLNVAGWEQPVSKLQVSRCLRAGKKRTREKKADFAWFVALKVHRPHGAFHDEGDHIESGHGV